jgi:pimeloyl-ACP methyl ester carboxylesterase
VLHDQATVREIRVGGVTLACRDVGDPDARPVVLLHALGNTGATWDRLVSVLAGRGHRVIAPDLRGHGDSSQPGEYSFELIRDDVLMLLDHLALDRLDLVGHSMGGHVASLIAQLQPERVRRLAIEDAPPPPHDEPAEAALRASTLNRGHSPVVALFQEFGDMRRAGTLDHRAVRPIIEGLRKADPAWWRRLPLITAATLVISGGLSSPVPRPLLARVADEIPDGTLLGIDAGHYVHSTEPERFCSAVAHFLG